MQRVLALTPDKSSNTKSSKSLLEAWIEKDLDMDMDLKKNLIQEVQKMPSTTDDAYFTNLMRLAVAKKWAEILTSLQSLNNAGADNK